MNNMQIKMAIKENLVLKAPQAEWTQSDSLRVDRMTMDAEKAMKTMREQVPGMSRAEAWSEVRNEFLTAP